MSDTVNSPSHYTQYPVEVIELTEHMNFNRGSATKYIARAGFKDPSTEIEDLQKARWYIDREIGRLETAQRHEEARRLEAEEERRFRDALDDLNDAEPLEQVDLREAQDRINASIAQLEAFRGTPDPSDGPWADGACDCGGD